MNYFQVVDDASLVKALDFLVPGELYAYDTETTGLDFNRDKVIGFGVSNATEGFYIPILVYDKKTNLPAPTANGSFYAELVLYKLKKCRLLMFNASFDYRMTKFSLGANLLHALHADVLLLKHTCDEDFPLDLKGIAKKLFGHDVTKEKEEMLESIKNAGGTSTEYYKASTETLAKYCVQDCLLTYRLFNHYSKELRRQDLENFYYNTEVLPLYREVVIPMEEVGVRINEPLMKQELINITNDLISLESSIQSSIAPHLHIFETWFLNKDYPSTTRTGKPAAWTKKYPTARDAYFATGAQYMFNLLSKHHLKKLFFDTLQETPLNKTPTGLPQVDEEFLDSMTSKHPWVSKLIEYNKLVKLKSTYIERILEESYNGRFFPSFAMHRTVSGRLAGDFQQLPRPLEDGQSTPLVQRYTNLIRTFFIPDEDSLLCSADYEQLEPSIFSHTSGDPALQRIFSSGVDFYSEVAISTEALTSVSSDKKSPNYLGKTNKVARQKAKQYALGIAYGMTGYKLQFEIGVSQEEAEELVAKYLRAFPKLASWINSSHDLAITQGFIKTQTGRVRHLGRAKILHERYGMRLLDSLQIWKDWHDKGEAYEEVKSYRREFKNLLNNAVNFQVQGLAASIVNQASISIVRKLKELNLTTRVVAQVHDELIFNIPHSERALVGPIIKDIMENCIKLSVPLRTEPQFGLNLRECK